MNKLMKLKSEYKFIVSLNNDSYKYIINKDNILASEKYRYNSVRQSNFENNDSCV